MNSISQQTRRESLRATDRPTRYATILEHWRGSMTAREIGYKLGYRDLNSVKPRITELVQQGKLLPVGKKYDTITERNVTVWAKAADGTA